MTLLTVANRLPRRRFHAGKPYRRVTLAQLRAREREMIRKLRAAEKRVEALS